MIFEGEDSRRGDQGVSAVVKHNLKEQKQNANWIACAKANKKQQKSEVRVKSKTRKTLNLQRKT